jgi:hypothetical protein
LPGAWRIAQTIKFWREKATASDRCALSRAWLHTGNAKGTKQHRYFVPKTEK